MGTSTMHLALVTLSLFSGSILAQEEVSRWRNKEIEVIRTKVPTDGAPLIVAVKHNQDYVRTACTIYLPTFDTGVYYYIEDGVVYEGSGQIPEGVEAWTDGEDSNTCGIRILEKTSTHEENEFEIGFYIVMEFENLSLFGMSGLNSIDAEINIKSGLTTRIPSTTSPFHYSLKLLPDLKSTSPEVQYSGSMSMSQAIGQESGFPVYFHLDGPDITGLRGSIKTPNEEISDIEFFAIQYNLQKGVVDLLYYAAFSPEDILTLDIDFEANLPGGRNWIGLYKEKCSEGSDLYCWFTQFEATGARQAFPCRDEPDKKAVFDIQVGRRADLPLRTLANMPLAHSEELEGGIIMDTFQTTPVMSSYLIAFAIQDYSSVGGSGNLTVWANDDQVAAGLADFSAEIGPEVIQFYSDTFNMPYSLPKMDMVAVLNKGGAMENWGLILYSVDSLLYDASTPDEEKKWRVAEVVAHEIAHQWFGNLVTLAWWDQTWLNEGFATYVSHMGAYSLGPEYHSWGRMVVHRMFRVMMDDSKDDSWPMTGPPRDGGDVGEKFGSITYHKGASVIRMMEGILGKETLYAGLASYLYDLQYSNAVEEDLFGNLEIAGLSSGSWPQGDRLFFTQTMQTWTNQIGYPLVSVDVTDGVMAISQSWYRDDHPDSTEQLWDIPITWVELGDNTPDTEWEDVTPMTWLSGESKAVDLSSVGFPVILNKQAFGYFRVNYNFENWMKIAEVLATNHEIIPPLNRAQIICDLISLSRTEHVSESLKDSVLSYQDQETHFTPLYALKQCSMTQREEEDSFIFQR